MCDKKIKLKIKKGMLPPGCSASPAGLLLFNPRTRKAQTIPPRRAPGLNLITDSCIVG